MGWRLPAIHRTWLAPGTPAILLIRSTTIFNNQLFLDLRLWLGMALGVIAVVYWFASYEPAGTTMLGLAAALAALCGVYLRVQSEPGEPAAGHDTDHYLPDASVWPFGIGLGALLAANGFILGIGFAIPGVVILGVSVAGLVSQSRRRV